MIAGGEDAAVSEQEFSAACKPREASGPDGEVSNDDHDHDHDDGGDDVGDGGDDDECGGGDGGNGNGGYGDNDGEGDDIKDAARKVKSLNGISSLTDVEVMRMRQMMIINGLVIMIDAEVNQTGVTFC